MGLLNYTFTQFWFVDAIAPRNAFLFHDSRNRILTPSLPPVKYVPAWFPGATFQRIAKRSSELSHYIRNQPWKDVLERVRTRFGTPFVHPSPKAHNDADLETWRVRRLYSDQRYRKEWTQ